MKPDELFLQVEAITGRIADGILRDAGNSRQIVSSYRKLPDAERYLLLLQTYFICNDPTVDLEAQTIQSLRDCMD